MVSSMVVGAKGSPNDRMVTTRKGREGATVGAAEGRHLCGRRRLLTGPSISLGLVTSQAGLLWGQDPGSTDGQT